MNILVTGANGQLGTEIQKIVEKIGNGHPNHLVGEPNYYIFTARNPMSSRLKALDITNRKEVLDFMHTNKISVVVNCAAYTASDKAELDYDSAFAVNVRGVENLAEGCKRIGAVLIHISTDYVFNGAKNSPYEPTDETNPLSVYGTTKRMGELKALGCESIILRTSWLFGGDKKNFVKTMDSLLETRDEIKVVNDQWGRPTYAGDLAEFIVKIISEHNFEHPYLNRTGIYHFCNHNCCTWFTLTELIKQMKETVTGKKYECNVIPCTTEEYPTPAKRPAYSILSTKTLEETFDYVPRPFTDALIECVQKYNTEVF